MKKILILNGPNLNLTGKREVEIYGKIPFEGFIAKLQKEFEKEFLIDYKQSNHEGTLVDLLQESQASYEGIILNAAAYCHSSLVLADAIKAIKIPLIEVHLSNIYAREPYRKHSFISEVAQGVICGFGLNSYRLALLQFLG